jgi:hypothetical protein
MRVCTKCHGSGWMLGSANGDVGLIDSVKCPKCQGDGFLFGPAVSLKWRWTHWWVGFFVDAKNRAVYICPLPTVVIKVYW